MPTYEYRCASGHDFEQFYRKISDAPAAVSCPDCGAAAERRLSGGAGLLFKGSGFYLTDDGRGGAKKPDSGDGAGAGDARKPGKEPATKPAGDGAAPKSETKPADKPAKKSE